MTDKKAPESDFRHHALLEEVDLLEDEADYDRILEELSQDPAAYGCVEPPAGYETHLLNALKEQIPELNDQSQKTAEAKPRSSWFAACMAFVVGSRGISWSLSGGLAVLVAVMAFQMNSNRPVDPLDMVGSAGTDGFLMETAQNGDSTAVARWVASVADLGVQLQVQSGSEALLQEMVENPDRANQALDDVARSLGYQGDI